VLHLSAHRVALLAALGLAFAGCGTAVFHHTVELSALNGPPRVEVAVFDHTMGYSREWAHQHLGPSPHTGTFDTHPAVSAATAHVAHPINVALAIPELTDDGYFLLDVAELSHESAQLARFTRYGAYFPDDDAPTIPVTVTSAADGGAWNVHATVDLVAARQSLEKRR
jgi:hypothetical protein